MRGSAKAGEEEKIRKNLNSSLLLSRFIGQHSTSNLCIHHIFVFSRSLCLYARNVWRPMRYLWGVSALCKREKKGKSIYCGCQSKPSYDTILVAVAFSSSFHRGFQRARKFNVMYFIQWDAMRFYFKKCFFGMHTQTSLYVRFVVKKFHTSAFVR